MAPADLLVEVYERSSTGAAHKHPLTYNAYTRRSQRLVGVPKETGLTL